MASASVVKGKGAALRAGVAGPPLLADPRFVLEKQADMLVFTRALNVFE
jgi:hypothetical protein